MLMQASCQLACWHKEAECTQESAYAAQACCNVDAGHQEAECSQDSGSCSTGLLSTGASHWLLVLLMYYLLIRPLPATLAVSIAGGQAQLPGRPTHPIAATIDTIYNYREDSAACCTGTAFTFSGFATCTPSSFPSPSPPPPPPPKDGASSAGSQTSGKLEALASQVGGEAIFVVGNLVAEELYDGCIGQDPPLHRHLFYSVRCVFTSWKSFARTMSLIYTCLELKTQLCSTCRLVNRHMQAGLEE